MRCARKPTNVKQPKWHSLSTSSTACWRWDARATSASYETTRTRDHCVHRLIHATRSRSIELAVIPQLPLTLTNAVIVTASLCRDMFPADAARASERRLALSSGVANLVLAPFGAMPMCHGAGGLQAQYRFGARTVLAAILVGGFLLVIGVGFAERTGA